MSGTVTAERTVRAEDFLRFLRTQGQQIDGLTKVELKGLYENEYHQYRSQLYPGEPVMPFKFVLQTLLGMSKLHLQGHIFKYGPPSGNSQSDSNVRTPQQSYGASNFHGSEPTLPASLVEDLQVGRSDCVMTGGPKPRRRHHPGNRLAVDQHIIFNKPTSEPNVLSADSTQENDELETSSYTITHMPDYIKRLGQVYECTPCAARCTSMGELQRHLQGRRHRLGVITMKLKSKRKLLMQDKYNIQVKSDCEGDDGTYFLDLREGIESVMTLIVKNNSTKDVIDLMHCEMLKRIRVFSLHDEKGVTEQQDKVAVLPGSTYKIQLKAMAKNVGNYHTPLGFQFNLNGMEFHIVKFIHARCKNTITDQVRASKPYRRPPRQAWRGEATEIVEGLPLPKWSGDNLSKKIVLERYRIPDPLRKIINHGLKINQEKFNHAERIEMSALKSMLESKLDCVNYEKRFSAMNYFEETQMEVDIRKYDMEAVSMRICPHNHKLLMLGVPGLSENRPSVLRGDWLYVRINADGTAIDKEYQGYVHLVQQNEVALGFNKRLMEQFVNNMKFNIRFVFNRLPLRLQHRACALALEEGLEDFLFPRTDTICTRGMNIIPLPLKLYNRDLENNAQQSTAIMNIISGISRPAPYLVFGPPGTGKTVTVVEAMMQIWKNLKKCHILACAPSNSAADLITSRLLKHIPKKDILRLNAFSRTWEAVAPDIKEVCNYDNTQHQYFYPGQEEIERYKIVVCTLVTAGRLVSANFPSGHFSHLFVDESGHAVEPECLIPLAGILSNDLAIDCGQVVLAGDPKQLGPILRSPFAIEYGLEVSLLERYMTQCDVYKRSSDPTEQAYDDRIISKLLRNYRSHPAILDLPNRTFYDGELKNHADEGMRESFCTWEGLPRKGFPVIFHAVIGQDEREERSPSFFNAAEVSMVIYYIELLLQKKGYRLQPKDIGIISPYRKQVQKIQAVLRQKHLTEISVGSVEEFQGQERLVIIVSTVRSNPEYLSLDIRYKLGFLKNPKRFNVTLTRAKALLVVIGNPQSLAHDKHWKSFIEYCKYHGAYTGEVCEMDEEETLQDLEQRLENMGLWDREDVDKTAKFVQDYGIRNDSAIAREK